MNAATSNFITSGKRVWVTGHRGMVGSAIMRRLQSEDCLCVTVDRDELDLRNQADVEKWITSTKPDIVFAAAGRVGGIQANCTQPVEFLCDNLLIAANVITTAFRAGVQKLIFLSSSCAYPRLAEQPMHEEALLSGSLEPTNEWYAIAKIAGMKLAQAFNRQYQADFFSIVPTNLYGPGDNYHPEHSHVPAALIRRFHEAKLADAPEVIVWGSGNPRREFLAVDDLADACVFLMKNHRGAVDVNVGTGSDISIADFARLVAEVVGYTGKIVFDQTRPDGAPRKLLDITRLSSFGWQARIPLKEGLVDAYADFVKSGNQARGFDAPLNKR